MSTAPPKPWEKLEGRSLNPLNSSHLDSAVGDIPHVPVMDDRLDRTKARMPPPVPARQSDTSYPMSAYSSGMPGYSTFGNYGYGGGGMYGGYGMYGGGMYGSGYNRFGMNSVPPNSFVRQAEESSRQAFQSIESIVQAFGSVAMMLESTFHAVYNSFRAVLGVADHFTRMKLHFSQIFSAMALLRTLKWLYHKLLVMLRMREGGLSEDVWKEAVSSSDVLGASAKRKSSWPILLFFAVVIGGPWIIWKILSSVTGEKEKRKWSTGQCDHFQAVAEYDFQASQEDELSFVRGQKITIAPADLQPRMKGWLLASVDGEREGMIPANHVKVLGKRRGTQQKQIQKPVAADSQATAWNEGQNASNNEIAWESSSSSAGSVNPDGLNT